MPVTSSGHISTRKFHRPLLTLKPQPQPGGGLLWLKAFEMLFIEVHFWHAIETCGVSARHFGHSMLQFLGSGLRVIAFFKLLGPSMADIWDRGEQS